MIRTFCKQLPRTTAVITVVLILSSFAGAYTLVLKGGRRIEVPSDFIVASTAVIYSVSDGIQVAVDLNSIDFVATELANHEAPGSFRTRLTKPPDAHLNTVGNDSVRTITNQQLERFRKLRERSESAYEQRRKELGLPSQEEIRKRAAANLDRANQEAIASLSESRQNEEYWRSRATQLRLELAAIESQITYLRTRIDEAAGSAVIGPGFIPVAGLGPARRSPRSTLPNSPGVYTPRSDGPQASGRFTFGYTNPIHPVRHDFSRVDRLRSGTFVALPYGLVDYPAGRSLLQSHLEELLLRRTALQSYWHDLEDEARRAGAYPGWLRP